MPVTVAEQRAASTSLSLSSTSSPSCTVIPCRRAEYVHVLLLVEEFTPLSTLPLNTRVIAQTESPIDLTLPSDDDHFLHSIDYSALPTLLPSTTLPSPPPPTAATPHSSHVHIAQHSLLLALHSMLTLLRRHYGPQSTISPPPNSPTPTTPSSSSPTRYPVHLQTLTNVTNPINPKGDSTYSLIHHLTRRPLSTQGKVTEALAKVAYVASRPSAQQLRLDYLALNETTVPSELFELRGRDVREVTLAFNHFLYFPPRLCDSFTQLRVLNMSGNRELFHVPAEVGKLTQLQVLDLTDCSNLISLPLTLPSLTHLTHLHLFGCTNLTFPPHAVALRTQLATQGEGQSLAGVRGLLDYIRNPQSFLSFNLNEAKRALTRTVVRSEVYNAMRLGVVGFRTAYGGGYVEYELRVAMCGVEWVVWRRFSQFRALVEELERLLPAAEWARLAKLPGKTWALHEEDGEVCEERRKAMDALCEGLRQFEERNEKQRHAEVKEGRGKGGKRVKGLNELGVVRTFFEVDANVEM